MPPATDQTDVTDFGPDTLNGTPPAAANPDAPYGYNPDTGKPYRYSAEVRKAMGDRMAAGRTAKAQAAGSKRTRAAKAARAKEGPPPPSRPPGKSTGPTSWAGKADRSRADQITELLGALGMGLALAGARLKMPSLCADGIVIGSNAPALAEVADELGDEHTQVGAILDFVVKASPYAKLASVLGPVVTQLAANHRVLPGGLFGTQPRDQLIAEWLESMGLAGIDITGIMPVTPPAEPAPDQAADVPPGGPTSEWVDARGNPIYPDQT